MAKSGYSVIPGDWIALEQIINELGYRILTEEKAISDYMLKDGSRPFTGIGAGFVDDDTFTNPSDRAAPSAQSVKEYVDNSIGSIPRILRMNELVKDTAITVTIGQFINYADGKTLLYDAMGGNDNFDPSLLKCTLTKGTSQSTLTLTKSGGSNDMNLVSGGMATFEFAAGNVDTNGKLILSFENATAGSEIILPKIFEFFVVD